MPSQCAVSLHRNVTSQESAFTTKSSQNRDTGLNLIRITITKHEMRFHQRLIAELGLVSLVRAPGDTKLIILQRFVRFFAFGGSTIVLALYLHSLKLPDSQIGLFMSLTLVGDVISFGLALLADGIGRKVVLGFGALLMVFSGVVFAFSGNFWVLLAAGVVGVISPK